MSEQTPIEVLLRSDAASTNIHAYQRARMLEAADTIERLQREVEELRGRVGALPPVAATLGGPRCEAVSSLGPSRCRAVAGHGGEHTAMHDGQRIFWGVAEEGMRHASWTLPW